MATAQTEAGVSVIRTPDQRLRIFVSSTLEELAAERAALRRAIEGLHLTPVMFELGASPHPPKALYRAYLEQSHVFVGVYWQRYGWVAPDMEVSGLEDEYLLSEGMPRLVYFKEPAEHEEEMGEFVKRVKAGGNSFRKFRSTDELAQLLQEDLAHLLTERFESERDDAAASAIEAAAMPSVLPEPITRLVGREGDVSRLLELLSREDVRLVTLTGVGGIGKSRLALAVAREVQREGERRVAFVDLTAVTDPDSVLSAIAVALGVSDEGPLIGSIAARLCEEPTLLVLDNFEQVVEASRHLSELLAACPGLKVMVASRILLDVRGEHHWDVEPLHTSAAGCAVDDLAGCSAIQLFIARAQAADPRFVLDERNAEQLGELCRRLEGLPLAIELTAAYVRLLPPQALLDRFEDRLDLEAHADHPQRQRTLRTTIDWSYGLLDEAERELFARLAVFTGGWTLPAAQAVCGEDCRADVLQTLSNLVDKSLVTIVDGQGVEPRFRMLETVRVYALERLTESGELADMQLRHAEYFAELCAEVGRKLEEQDMWFPALDQDRDNLMVIHERAAGDERLIEPLIRLWASVWTFAWARGLVKQILDVIEEFEDFVRGRSPDIRARYAFLMGSGLFVTGDPDRGRPWSEQVLKLTDDERLRALALLMVGGSYTYEEGRDEAEAALTECIELSRKLGFLLGLDLGLAQLGVIRLRDGRFDEAIERYEECLQIGRSLNGPTMTAFALGQLGFAHLAKGDLAAAQRYLAECAEYCRLLERAGVREASAVCLEALAALAGARDKPELAAKLVGASQAIREVIAIPVWPLFAPLAEQFVASLNEQLGTERYEALATEGAALSTEDALSVGLE